MTMTRVLPSLLCGLVCVSCTEGLPPDITGYADRCVRLNLEPLPETPADSHRGVKNVFACDVEAGALLVDGQPTLPYADGTLIVKESRRKGQDYVWLIATMRKDAGKWSWDEYTRNFDDQDFARLPVPENVCADCHARVAAADWVYTPYSNHPAVER